MGGGSKDNSGKRCLGLRGIGIGCSVIGKGQNSQGFRARSEKHFSEFLEGFLLGMVKSGYGRGLKERKEGDFVF